MNWVPTSPRRSFVKASPCPEVSPEYTGIDQPHAPSTATHRAQSVPPSVGTARESKRCDAAPPPPAVARSLAPADSQQPYTAMAPGRFTLCPSDRFRSPSAALPTSSAAGR